MNRLVFEDSIILYCDKEWELPDGIDYVVYLNGKEIAKTKKTHYTFSDLESQKSYDIKIERIDNTIVVIALPFLRVFNPCDAK